MHPIQERERERKGEVEDPGMELGILTKKSVHIPSVPSRCKTTKTPPPCAFEVHHTYTYDYLRISIYVPQSFSSTLTYSQPTYHESLLTNQRYIYLPTPNQIPPQIPRIQYLPTWYIVQTTLPSLTGPHTYQYYIHYLYTQGSGSPQAGSVLDCNRNFRL